MKVFDLLPAQTKLFKTPDNVDLDVAIYQGGFGSGKTWAGSLLGLDLAKRFPGSIGIVVAKTHKMVADTTLKKYFDHLDDMGYQRGKHYTFNKSDSRLIFPYWGRSEIMFRHIQDPEDVKSLTADWIQMEEASLLSEADFLALLGRVRGSKCKPLRVYGHTNPQPNKGWIYKHFVEGGGIKETWDERLKRNVRVCYRRIMAPTTENAVNLPPGYVQNMADSYSDDYYRMNVLGEDVDFTTGLVCSSWSDLNKDRSCVYDPKLPIYLSCDFNVDPMCWEIAHVIEGTDKKPVYRFFDELCIENTTVRETIEKFADKYYSHKAGIVITGDATGKNRSDMANSPNDTRYKVMKQVLSDLGLRNIHIDINTSNPHESLRVEQWNNQVCNSDSVRRVYVNPDKCPKLVWNLENLKYIEGSSKIFEPTPNQIASDISKTLKYTKHPFDAASYLVWKYSPIEKTIGQNNVKPKVNTAQFSTGRY